MERQARRVHPLMIPLFLLALLLNACADGGAIVAPGGCGEELGSEEGIWIGSILAPGATAGSSLIGMIADGDFVVIQLAPNTQLNNPLPTRLYVGQYDPQTLTGTVQVFSGRGRFEQSGSLNIALGQRLNISLGGGVTTLLSLCPMRDNNSLLLYERDTVIEDGRNLLPGTWRYNVPQTGTAPGYTLDLTMDTIGVVSGSDTLSCAYAGFWSDPRPNRNLYRLEDFTLSGPSVAGSGACDVDDGQGIIVFEGGGYNGFAMYFDATSRTAQVLWTVVSNGEAAFFTAFDRVGPSLLPAPPINDPFEDEFS